MLRIIVLLMFCISMLLPAARAEEREDIRYGTPMSSGGPLIVSTQLDSVTTSIEDGQPIGLVSVNTRDGALVQIINLNTGKTIRSFQNPEWKGGNDRGCIDRDGNIYFNLTSKVMKYSPEEKELEFVAQAPTRKSGLISGLVYDEKEHAIYGAAPNYGNIFRLDCETYEISVLTSLSPECLAINRPDFVGDYVYAGGILNEGDSTYLYKINKYSGERTRIPHPDGVSAAKKVSEVYSLGKYISAQYDGINYIWDTEKECWTGKTFQHKTTRMSNVHNGERYFAYNNTMHSINIETLEITDYPIEWNTHYRGSESVFVELDDPDFPGYSTVTATFSGGLHIMNFETGNHKKLPVKLKGGGLELRISAVGSDDCLYVMGFRGTYGARWNPRSGFSDYFTGEQGEGICTDPETGLMYHGDYASAYIYEMDPKKPYSQSTENFSDTNSKLICKIGEEQDRPFGIDVAGRNLVVGTISKGYTIGGALSVINLDTYEKDVYRNIIQGQGVLTVTHKDNIVYAGTTVSGGVSSVPTTKRAHVFSFDLDTRKIVKDVLITIPGYEDVDIVGVHGLKIGPDGMLYGAVYGADFVMDPDTLEIVRYNVYDTNFETDSEANSQCWHQYRMVFDKESGYLFRQGNIIDPQTLEMIVKEPGLGQFAGLDSKGNAYFVANDTTSYKVPVIKGEDKSYLIGGLNFFKLCSCDRRYFRSGEEQIFDTYEDAGRMMVPVRIISNTFGGAVEYDAETKKVQITSKKGDILSYTVKDNKITIGEKTKILGVTIAEKNGTSYLPLNTLLDFLGGETYHTEDGICFIYPYGEKPYINDGVMEYIRSEVFNIEKKQ